MSGSRGHKWGKGLQVREGAALALIEARGSEWWQGQ